MNNIELKMGIDCWGGVVKIDSAEVHPRKVVLIMEAGSQPQVYMSFFAGHVTAHVDSCSIKVVKEDDPK